MIAETVRRAQGGDEQAFAELYERYRNRVFASCLTWTKNRETAEDLTQDVFISVLRHLHTYRGESQFGTWLYRISRNITLMHFRKHAIRTLSLEDNESEDGTPLSFELSTRDRGLDSAVDRIAVWRAIGTLAPRQKRTIILKEILGMDHREVARAMDCTIGNSKSQVHKAKEKVQRALDPKLVRRRLRPEVIRRHDYPLNDLSRRKLPY